MKKYFVILTLMLMVSEINASTIEKNSFVACGGMTYYFSKIQVGIAITRIFLLNGEMIKIPTAKIDAYTRNGELYEKLPVINKNRDTVGWAFMQFIASNSVYRLYRYCSNCNHYDPATGEIAPTLPVYRYYIYEGRKFFSLTDDQNTNDQLALFGLKMHV